MLKSNKLEDDKLNLKWYLSIDQKQTSDNNKSKLHSDENHKRYKKNLIKKKKKKERNLRTKKQTNAYKGKEILPQCCNDETLYWVYIVWNG